MIWYSIVLSSAYAILLCEALCLRTEQSVQHQYAQLCYILLVYVTSFCPLPHFGNVLIYACYNV
ncbi:hypothetical protein JOM56_013263 [Amanita muscaria]